jgi:hypothetical protein
MKNKKQLALTNGTSPAPRNARTKHTPRARTRIWQRAFLQALRKVPNVKAACAIAGITRRVAYDARDNDPEFAGLWLHALGESVDKVEAKVFQQAIDGDAQLAMFLLKNHKREVYGDVSRLEIDQRLCGVILLPPKENLPP